MDRTPSSLGKLPLPQTNMCQVCKAEEFEKDDDGDYACVICGNVLQGYVSIDAGVDDETMGLYKGSRRMVDKGLSKAQKALSKEIVFKREQFSQSQELSQQLSQLSQAHSTEGNDDDTAVAAAAEAEEYYALFSEEKRERTIELESYLHYFQSSLKLLLEEACGLMRVSGEERNACLQEACALWFSYLNRWMEKEEEAMQEAIEDESGGSHSNAKRSGNPVCLSDFLVRKVGGFDINAAVSEAEIYDSLHDASTTGSGGATKKHKRAERSSINDILLGGAVFPSKRLLLGLLYLCIRVRRYPIVPAHIVRWCYEGRLSYFGLAAAMGKRGLTLSRHSGKFFDLSGRGGDWALTATNVFFHTVLVARELHMAETLAPLNASLVARQFVCDLGLPEEVWVIYSHLCQMYGPAETRPLGLFCGRHDECYAETVMAGVIVAVKMSSDWMDWKYSNSSSSSSSTRDLLLPHSKLDLDRHLPRRALQSYLARLSSVCSTPHALVVPVSVHHFNKKIRGFIEGDEASFVKPIPTLMVNNSCTSSGAEPKCALLSKIATVARQGGEMKRKRKRKRKRVGSRLYLTHYRWEHPEDYTAVNSMEHAGESSSMSVRAAPHLEYSLLVERAAAYLCVGPMVLHLLVESFDKELLDDTLGAGVVDGNRQAAKGSIAPSAAGLQRGSKSYFDVMLPLYRALGQSGALEA